MLVVDSSRRYTISDIVEHSWLKTRSDEVDGSDLDLATEYRALAEDDGVSLDSELGQQILSHMSGMGLDSDLTAKVGLIGLGFGDLIVGSLKLEVRSNVCQLGAMFCQLGAMFVS